MNKTTVFALCFVLVVGVVAGVEALNRSNSLEVVKIDKEVVEVNPNLHLLEDEDAVQAAKDVIRRKQAEQELNAVQGNIEALRASFETELSLLEEQEEVLELELGVF